MPHPGRKGKARLKRSQTALREIRGRRLNLSIDEWLHRRAKMVAAARGQTLASLVSTAIEEYLDELKEEDKL